MKTRTLSLLPLVVLCLATSAFSNEITRAKLYVVRDTADTVDANPGDEICADATGKCTLRAAVDETNATKALPDSIIFDLSYPAVIELTLGPLELSSTYIIGPGARHLTIRRNPTAAPFRLFNAANVVNGYNGPIVRGLRLEGGSAGNSGDGGALRIEAGVVVEMLEVWITGNSAANGGAIWNEGKLTITRSLIVGNTAGGTGGGLHLAASSNTRITNSTITSNSAATGGAIFAAGAFLSANNTITHNAASSAASGITSASGSAVSLLNTIVGADTSLPVTTLSGNFNSLGSNLVTDARTSTGFTNAINNDQVSDNNSIDPLLGSLANNGGSTDTRALPPNSPAIDRGNTCVTDGSCVGIPQPPLRLRWDQRVAFPRFALTSPVDVGAFESGSTRSAETFNIGIFRIGAGPRRNGRAMLVNVTTGERRFKLTDLFGNFSFRDLDVNYVYVMDWQSKAFETGPVSFPVE